MARYKKRTSKGAIFAVIVSLITLAAFIMGILTDWYTNFRKYLPKSSGDRITANADELYAPDAGLLISQSTSDGIMLFSAATPLADFETYSLDGNVEAVKTITARITPADTTLQKVDYTAAWRSSGSGSWANGKDVNDYITLTQSSDGSLDCAVSLKDAIGTQIVITCTARPLEDGDWVPSATCTVDYYQRSTDCKVSFSGRSEEVTEEDTYFHDEYDITLGTDVIKYVDSYAEDYDYVNNVSVIQTYGTGTIIDSVNESTVTVKVKISDSIASKIKTAAGVSTLQSYTLATNGTTTGFMIKTAITQILGGTTNVNNHRNAIYTAFKEVYDKGQTALTFEISYTTSMAKFDYTFTKESLFNPTALGVKATNVDLDKPGIIF